MSRTQPTRPAWMKNTEPKPSFRHLSFWFAGPRFLLVGAVLGAGLVLAGQWVLGSVAAHVQYRPEFVQREAYRDGWEAATRLHTMDRVHCERLARLVLGGEPGQPWRQDQRAFVIGCDDKLTGKPYADTIAF